MSATRPAVFSVLLAVSCGDSEPPTEPPPPPTCTAPSDWVAPTAAGVGTRELADSELAWGELRGRWGNSYLFERTFDVWADYQVTTTLRVESGEVVARHVDILDDGVHHGFLEEGAEVGTHRDGHPAVSIDRLYEKCQDEVLTQDPKRFVIEFRTWDNDLLRRCGYYPYGCTQECWQGVSVDAFRFCE